MSFNPVMALLTQAVLPHCAGAPAVLEFGNQTFTVDASTLSRIAERAAQTGQDVAALRRINALDMTARRDRVAAYYCRRAVAERDIEFVVFRERAHRRDR